MDYRRNEFWDYAIPAVIVVYLGGFAKLSFIETMICGLLVAMIIGAFKFANKKKLGAHIMVGEPVGKRCRVCVLLWNPMWFRAICDDDFGVKGFGLMTNRDTIIESAASEFDFHVSSRKPDSIIELRLSEIPPKTFVQLDFTLSSVCEENNAPIIFLPTIAVRHFSEKSIVELMKSCVPHRAKTTRAMIRKPRVYLMCDRSKLDLQVLPYKKIRQITHWLFSILAIVCSTAMASVTVWFITTYDSEHFQIISSALITILFFITIFIPHSKVIPPFIVKLLKSKAQKFYEKT